MTSDGNGRSVLTTGANSGIGLATVIEIAKRGYHSIGSVRSEEKAGLVAKAAADAGVEVETVLMDVTDEKACHDVLSRFELYGLVNNAGYGVNGAVEDVDDEEARKLFETMVHGPIRLARLAAPGMRDVGEGRIINMSSVFGLVTAPFAGHYAAAKHALEALSDALRIELAHDGIKVILIEPGGFKTSIWEEFESDIDKREQQGSRFGPAYKRALWGQKLIEPLMGRPEWCARVVAVALDARYPRSRYVVGLDAQLMNLATRVTPTFLRDRFLRISFGI